MLGSVTEAEDVVQDTWLRWQTTDHETVRDAASFLATTTTRLAINVLKSARSGRETYVGSWLPEPIDTGADPSLRTQRGEDLELAVLLLLEKLTPTERAAYVLREAFEYEYVQIAAILQVREDNVRQLVTRARKHLTDERKAPVAPAEHGRLLQAFLAAVQLGDHAALESLLAADVISTTDGNGVVHAARVPVAGRARVLKFVSGFPSAFWVDATFTPVEANGRPAVLLSRDGSVFALLTVVASSDGIEQLLWVMSPAKLAGFAARARS